MKAFPFCVQRKIDTVRIFRIKPFYDPFGEFITDRKYRLFVGEVHFNPACVFRSIIAVGLLLCKIDIFKDFIIRNNYPKYIYDISHVGIYREVQYVFLNLILFASDHQLIGNIADILNG